MSAVNAQTKYDEGRLMQVLVAPIVSEKATMIAENPIRSPSRSCRTLPNMKSRPLWN